ncbi:MAG: BspA family leucine-rich repeat surface protein [Bacteroidota bacterium]|nr:BspA family leucine-rich repeat surface protein [Bacteroidota bacterium]
MCVYSEYGAMPNWDVSNVTDMSNAFENRTTFNADISTWNVSSVTNMKRMFYSAGTFNADISAWNVSSVINMERMFYNVDNFNRDIGSWDVSNVTNMTRMFMLASSFNQDLSLWCVTNLTSEPESFSAGSSLSESNKPVWGTCSNLPIDEKNQLYVLIYPNPTSDKLFIKGLSSTSKVSIYNVLGEFVLSSNISYEVDVKHLSKGVYNLKIIDKQKETTRKFIVH